MRILLSSVKCAVLTIALFGLFACNEADSNRARAQLNRLYVDHCPEAKAVPFDQLGPQSLCGGVPVLNALAAVDAAAGQQDIAYLLDVLIRELRFSPDLQAAGTGLTAAMVAVDRGAIALGSELSMRSNPLVADANGRNVLHHLAAAKWSDYSTAIVNGPNLWSALSAGDSAGVTPLSLAASEHNISFVWSVFVTSRRPEVFDGFEANFLFDARAERYVSWLDVFGQRLLRPFSGSLNGRTVKDFTMLHFAAQASLPDLTEFLLGRGASPAALSSLGSPMALALDAGVNATTGEETARWRRTVEVLLHKSEALAAPDALTALMHAGDLNWVQRALRAKVALEDYHDLLFGRSNSNGVLQTSLFVCYQSRARCDLGAVRAQLGRMGASPANEAGQNAAHFFFTLVPDADVPALAGGVLTDGFKWFARMAATQGWLDQADVLGNQPIHSWLMSANRSRSGADETSQLNLLLRATRDPLAFNWNHDSILSLAVRTGRLPLVAEILKTRPDAKKLIEVPNLAGDSPLSYAERTGGKEIYDLLNSAR